MAAMKSSTWCARAAALLLACACCPTGSLAQPAAPFTLADALARAREVAPENAAAAARVEAARQGASEAGRWANPVFEFRQENWLSGVSRDELPLDTFAEVTQLIEIGGKRGARKGIAEAQSGLEDAMAAVTRRQLSRDVARTYLDALRQRERHRTLTAQAADLREMVRVMDRRVALGTTAEADLLKLRTEEARAGLDLVRSDVGASRALAELGARLGLDPAIESLELPTAPPVDARDPAAALGRRPDITLAQRSVEAARQTLRLEDARAVPDPSVNGGWKRTVGYDTAQFTVSMPLPLFNRNHQARIIAEGAVKAAELDLAATERRARGELEATRQAAERLGARARDARATLLEPARAARDAARAAYRAGALDVLRLVDAERVATEAALVVTDLEIDAVAAAIDARLAAGEDPLP
jgi:cobalt-zinc-cadmium efflux system outer membrane protein